MKPFVHLTFPTGHVYEIHAAIIADNRAREMLAAHPDEFKTYEEALEDTVGLFEDNYAVEDWARNNMNWEPDLAPHARLVRFNPPELDHVNDAEWGHSDAPMMMAELDGDAIMQSPVAFAVSMMAMTGQLCNVTLLQQADENGQAKPYAAVALIIGNEHVIGAYTTGMQVIGDSLMAGATQPTTH